MALQPKLQRNRRVCRFRFAGRELRYKIDLSVETESGPTPYIELVFSARGNTMGNKGFIRRILPFLATFAVGVFITSFFVNISGPRFGSGHRGKGKHKFYQLKAENEELKNENLRLRNEIESLRFEFPHIKHPGHEDFDDLELMVPPPPMPVAPKAKR